MNFQGHVVATRKVNFILSIIEEVESHEDRNLWALMKILINKKSMVCTLGLIWGQQGVEAYKRRYAGEGPTFRERKITRVSFEECEG